jgi:hypothetical protein
MASLTGPITLISPDGRHQAVLSFSGEIRHGPMYYSLTLDGRSFRRRIFGDAGLWSPDSIYFAVQEWGTTSYTHGPQTHLLVIDLQAEREVSLCPADKGFSEPRAFEGDRLVCAKVYYSEAGRREETEELFLSSVNNWSTLRR